MKRPRTKNRLGHCGPLGRLAAAGSARTASNLGRHTAVGSRSKCHMHGDVPGSRAPLGNQNARKRGVYVPATIDDLHSIRALWASASDMLGDISQRDKS